MRNANGLSDWAKDCRKTMIDRNNMTVTELAEALGISRTIISAVINGSRQSDDVRQRICDYLNVDSRL